MLYLQSFELNLQAQMECHKLLKAHAEKLCDDERGVPVILAALIIASAIQDNQSS